MDLTPLDKKRIRKVDGKKESFGATEHCYRQFEAELTLYADYLYHKLCLDADKNGMCFHSIRGLKSRLRCGHAAIYKAMDILKAWGLILFEKREAGYAFQVLPVPDYDLMKQRHITVHVHNPVVFSPNEIVEKLKLFDDAIKDPKQAPYRQSLETARTEFLKGLSKTKRS
jgi:biotin operon repressor